MKMINGFKSEPLPFPYIAKTRSESLQKMFHREPFPFPFFFISLPSYFKLRGKFDSYDVFKNILRNYGTIKLKKLYTYMYKAEKCKRLTL